MKDDESIWIGADPGGKGNFGIAILSGDNEIITGTVDCVDEAVSYVCGNVIQHPCGIGIDAPLWWSSGLSGGRLADQWLRDKYAFSGGEVQAVNSLRGAALAQGMFLVLRMRETYPIVQVTESHPKAVLKAIAQGNWEEFMIRFGLNGSFKNLHERDALIAAVCAREGFQNRWQNDLINNRYSSEQDPASYWLAPVHYFWPEE